MSTDLYQQKWRKFLRRVWLFKFTPFVDFVVAAGSLATGNVKENSDFDVIVGVRQGRIFTARAFCILGFGFFGWRRKKHVGSHELIVNSHKLAVADKFCFNHFVTPAACRLSEPHNEYWKKLYSSLIPVYGQPATIQKFFDANADWAGSRKIDIQDSRYLYKKRGLVALIREKILIGVLGNWLEQKLKTIQINRIEKSLKTDLGYKPRIIYSDNELEFHPDTKRAEDSIA